MSLCPDQVTVRIGKYMNIAVSILGKNGHNVINIKLIFHTLFHLKINVMSLYSSV